MKKYLFTNKLWLVGLICLATITTSAVVTILLLKSNRASLSQAKNASLDQVAVKARELTKEELADLQKLNLLLLGYGGPGHEGGYLTDVIQVAQIDFKNEQINLISIPRDLWVTLPNGQQAKINQALSLAPDSSQLVKSGGQIAKDMASIVTGLPIDYFAAVDFVGFQRLIGVNLGGIEVEVKETLEDPWYPIKGEELNPCGKTPEEIAQLTQQYSGFELERQFKCRYEHLLFEPGLIKMEGGDALKFVRSRHGSTAGDFSRSQRQQAVLAGVRKKLISLQTVKEIPEIFIEIEKNITTDIDLEAIKYLAPALKLTKGFDTRQIILSTDNVLTSGKTSGGQFILQPKKGMNSWQEVQAFIEQSQKIN